MQYLPRYTFAFGGTGRGFTQTHSPGKQYIVSESDRNGKRIKLKTMQIKRIYEDAETTDGYRILVDRIWPRGITKERAHLDEWDKEVAPSTELRKWFHHSEQKFEEFEKLYREELKSKPEELNKIREIAKKQKVTLLFAARNLKVNHAAVLL